MQADVLPAVAAMVAMVPWAALTIHQEHYQPRRLHKRFTCQQANRPAAEAVAVAVVAAVVAKAHQVLAVPVPAALPLVPAVLVVTVVQVVQAAAADGAAALQ